MTTKEQKQNETEKYEKPSINVVKVEVEHGVATSIGHIDTNKHGFTIQDVQDGGSAW